MITEYIHLFENIPSLNKAKKTYHEPWVSITKEGNTGKILSFKLGNDIACTFSGDYYNKQRVYTDTLGRKFILVSFGSTANFNVGTSSFTVAMLVDKNNYNDVYINPSALLDIYDVIYEQGIVLNYNLKISTSGVILTETPPADEIWYTTTDGQPIAQITEASNYISWYNPNYGSWGAYETISISNQYIEDDHIVIKLSQAIPDGHAVKMNDVDEDEVNWFKNCSTLVSVSFPDNIEYIPYRSFNKCTSLQSVKFPSKLVCIGPRAFEECNSLKTVTLPEGVESLCYGAFRMCSSLEEIYLPSTLITIGTDYSRDSRSSWESTIDSGREQYGGVFQDDGLLESITFPTALEEIGTYSFEKCSSLEVLYLTKNVQKLDETAFGGCVNLSVISCDPENQYFTSRDINDNECNCIYDLLGVLIVGTPSTTHSLNNLDITSIGPHAFDSRANLTQINIPQNIEEIGGAAFHATGLTSIHIPASVTSIDSWAFFHCKDLAQITVDPANPVYTSRDINGDGQECNCIYHKQSKAIVVGCMNTRIPSDCVAILSGSFNNHQKLSELHFPITLKYIGSNNTFNGDLSLTTIYYAGTRAQYRANVGTQRINEGYYGQDGSSWSVNSGNATWEYFDINTFQITPYSYWVPWVEFLVPCREVICSDGSITFS